MSTLSDHVSLTIVANTVGIAAAGFGTPLILSHAANWTERTRTYSDLAGVAADFASGTPEYLAAEAMFSQTPCPEQIKIGRAANKPTQQYTIGAVQVVNSDPYAINVVLPNATSATVTYTSDASATTQEIHNGLVVDLNAVAGANYSATFSPLPNFTAVPFTVLSAGAGTLTATGHGLNTGDGPVQLTTTGVLPAGLAVSTNYWIIKVDTNTVSLATSLANALAGTIVVGAYTGSSGTNDITHVAGTLSPSLPFLVTGSAAGNWFSLEISDPALLSNKQTHADPGVAADLDSILNQDSDWYALTTLFNSQLLVTAAAAWTEANKKIYLFDVPETDAITVAYTTGLTTDTLAQQHTVAHTRTAGSYHPSPANMMSAAWLGRMLPIDPGADDWKWKILSGVTPVKLTETHATNLRARSANALQTVATKNITWEGTVASGDFIDNTRGLDWIDDDMTKGVYAALINAGKTADDDGGIAVIENEVKSSLKRAVSAGILTSNPAPIVTVPKAVSQSSNDRALRTLNNVKFSANFAGAIHKVKLLGTVAV